MKVFKYWHRAIRTMPEFNYHLSSLGASNLSEQDAQAIAEQQLIDRVKRVSSGETLSDYEYGKGVKPEALIEELFNPKGECIAAITRNRYGALVLNCKNVLFADIDAITYQQNWLQRLFGLPAKARINKPAYLEKIESFSASYPQYELIVYETFAGFRVAVANHQFETHEEEATWVLSQLGADPLYQQLCQAQRCYRARLTPKPWRCGFKRPEHRFPYQSGQAISEMENWFKEYEKRSFDYCVCKKIKHIGRRHQHNEIKAVLTTHDAYVLGLAEMPLA